MQYFFSVCATVDLSKALKLLQPHVHTFCTRRLFRGKYFKGMHSKFKKKIKCQKAFKAWLFLEKYLKGLCRSLCYMYLRKNIRQHTKFGSQMSINTKTGFFQSVIAAILFINKYFAIVNYIL